MCILLSQMNSVTLSLVPSVVKHRECVCVCVYVCVCSVYYYIPPIYDDCCMYVHCLVNIDIQRETTFFVLL